MGAVATSGWEVAAGPTLYVMKSPRIEAIRLIRDQQVDSFWGDLSLQPEPMSRTPDKGK